MSKSKLTKNIEKALSQYKPAKYGDFEFNYRRGQYMEFEVPVTHSHIEDGLVDCVWLAEGYNHHRQVSYCAAASLRCHRNLSNMWDGNVCPMSLQQVKNLKIKDFVECMIPCVFKRQCPTKDEAVAIVCYEIKISRADFHSRNGHNFIGNLNFYVMPYGLYKEVRDEIPENIGVITYHYTDEDTIGSLRLKKHCTYNDTVDNALYNSLLHTFLNRKEKELRILKTDVMSSYHAVEDKCSTAVMKVIREMRKHVEVPDCYKKSYGESCSNATSIQIRCDTCPFGSIFKYRLIREMNLHEYFSSLLR